MNNSRLRNLRTDKDLLQIDVAMKTGIDQKTLSNYETGKTLPDADSLIKLADFYGVSIDYLVGRTDINIFSNQNIKNELLKMKKIIDAILGSSFIN